MIETETTTVIAPTRLPRPRLGFIGVGWIGRHRLEAVRASGLAELVAFFDQAPDAESGPGLERVNSLGELLEKEIDGVVIASPNALHAEQAVAALNRGKAVFCQKPLSRNGDECSAVIAAAQRADRLIGVDFSYRFCVGIERIRNLIQTGQLGEIYGVEMKFHNAYGPDKAWFYNRALSGGGCLLDLGVHLLDLVFWLFPHRQCTTISRQLFRRGRPLETSEGVEDYAAVQLGLAGGPSVQMVCSWRAPAGSDAEIEVTFLGTQGGARFSNINGSFYDFSAQRFYLDRSRETLATPPDDWGKGAILNWVTQLRASPRFAADAFTLLRTAETIDQIYSL